MKIDKTGGRHPTVDDHGIYGFFDEYRWLSNYHRCLVVVDKITYQSSEAAYMAQKSLDYDVRKALSEISNPNDAKKFGKTITLRPDWEAYKVLAMFEVVYAKFSQNEDLRSRLLTTGTKYLEETNNWGDTFWGYDPGKDFGYNMLGHVLMLVRKILT